MTVRFPDGFLWGAATAGHQVEGGNVNSDYWVDEWVEGSRFAEPSGDAVDHYHRYPEDIGLMGSVGLNAYRFSVEWSRIEPERGYFSRAALDHYRRMAETCLENGVTPVVTYSHWTIPRWFAQQGSWVSDDGAELFGRFAEKVTSHLGDLLSWVCTLNEPNLIAICHALMPHVVPWTPIGTLEVRSKVHEAAKAAIKSVNSDLKVGWTLALVDLQMADGGEEKCSELRKMSSLDWIDASADDDFVGVQTYSREMIGPDGVLQIERDPSLSMENGWELYPEALEHTIRLVNDRIDVPLMVTENGVATMNDEARITYTRAALEGVGRCLADGIDLRGYLHWSLLDNFEWESGFKMHFGLIHVDRTNFKRTVKPTMKWLGAVAQANELLPLP